VTRYTMGGEEFNLEKVSHIPIHLRQGREKWKPTRDKLSNSELDSLLLELLPGWKGSRKELASRLGVNIGRVTARFNFLRRRGLI